MLYAFCLGSGSVCYQLKVTSLHPSPQFLLLRREVNLSMFNQMFPPPEDKHLSETLWVPLGLLGLPTEREFPGQ